MSKKHFIAIAASLRAQIDESMSLDGTAALEYAALDLCSVFQQANPRFDRGKFLAACGVES